MSDTQKFRVTAVLELDAAYYPPDDEDAQRWLVNDILLCDIGDRLILHSNEIGDVLGVLHVERVEHVGEDDMKCGAIWTSYCDYLHTFGHECERAVNHDGRHECPCGSSWMD